MKYFLIIISIFIFTSSYSQKRVHVIVALNSVASPHGLGDSKNLNTNLYWGAKYGFKTYFKTLDGWDIVGSSHGNEKLLERLVMTNDKLKIHLTADAYNGVYIKDAITDFINGCGKDDYDLMVYLGHDGLLDFNVVPDSKVSARPPDVVVISCYSQDMFQPYLQPKKVDPLVWTTSRVAPEAYTLDYILRAWADGQSNESILNQAIIGYCHYQHCSADEAKHIFVTGYK